MAIKGGDLIHVGNTILIDRAQTGGPGQVNIPADKIYELGNYRSVATVYDTPDLTFSLDSLDVSAEIESMLVGLITPADDNNLGAVAEGTAIDLATAKPIDVVSEFKPGKSAPNAYDVVGSVAVPYLTLESASYRFGLTDNATQTFSLRTDSIFYNPSNAYQQVEAGPFAAGDTFTLEHPAHVYRGDVSAPKDATGPARWALSISTGAGKRLVLGVDYTETAVPAAGTTSTVTITVRKDLDDDLKVVYASPVVTTRPQSAHAAVGDPMVRPAAIRGKHISVYLGRPGTALTQLDNRWTAVQTVNIDWRVNLDRDQEFGNPQVVAQDFDVPDVSGSIELRPRDYADLYDRVRQITGVADGEVAGPLTARPLQLLVVLHNPESGAAMKSLYVPDARFTMPGYSGQTQQKMNVTLNFSSDSGELAIFKGRAPAAVLDPATP